MFLSVLMFIRHRELPIEGVTGELIADTTKKFGHKNVHYVADKKDIPALLNRNKKRW